MTRTESGIRKIELVTENVEVITIDGAHVGYFLLNDIKKTIGTRGCNCFGAWETAEYFAIEIKKEANIPYSRRNQNVTVFERLSQHKDITAVEIEYLDGFVDKYYVAWSKENEDINSFQKSNVDANMYIVIADGVSVQDAFSSTGDWPWVRMDWGKKRRHDPKKINLAVEEIEPFDNKEYCGINISWSSCIGWGNYTIAKNKKSGAIIGDSECMDSGEDKEFLEELLRLVSEKIIKEVQV